MLHPGRSISFHLSREALGRQTVSAQINATIGRVAAAMVGATKSGGIRASDGIPAPEASVTLPGGPDAGRSQLVVQNVGSTRLTLTGAIDRTDASQPLAQVRKEDGPAVGVSAGNGASP